MLVGEETPGSKRKDGHRAKTQGTDLGTWVLSQALPEASRATLSESKAATDLDASDLGYITYLHALQ